MFNVYLETAPESKAVKLLHLYFLLRVLYSHSVDSGI